MILRELNEEIARQFRVNLISIAIFFYFFFSLLHIPNLNIGSVILAK